MGKLGNLYHNSVTLIFLFAHTSLHDHSRTLALPHLVPSCITEVIHLLCTRDNSAGRLSLALYFCLLTSKGQLRLVYQTVSLRNHPVPVPRLISIFVHLALLSSLNFLLLVVCAPLLTNDATLLCTHKHRISYFNNKTKKRNFYYTLDTVM
jgi:hypothetical protein